MSLHSSESSIPTPSVPSAPSVPRAAAATTRALALVCVTEPLDLESSNRFLRSTERLGANCRCLVVDLTHAPFVDSAGIRTLLFLMGELERAERELWLVVPSGGRVERTLSLLRLRERFQIAASLDEAWRHASVA